MAAEIEWRTAAARAFRRYLVRIGYPLGIVAVNDPDLAEVMGFLES